MRIFASVFLILLIITGIGFRQGEQLGSSEWIIEVTEDTDLDELITDISEVLNADIEYLGLVSRIANLHLIGIYVTKGVKSRSINSLYDLHEVISITKNAEVNMRVRPNDTEYNASQQNMEIIEAPAAWDVTTGGVTPNGDTIVVAVIDEGFHLNHADLIDNLWVFRDEIAGDGIDNDGNGFVDDVHGWDAKNEIAVENRQNFHGTGVAGIVGASGNNSLGIAGINWNVKLLLVDIDAPTSVATVLRAYDYVLAQRRLYNTTGGQRGAYIVVTNNSFGVMDRRPEDFPAWCNFYNLLGQDGIMSVGATTNINVDVEIEGDLPSNCTSDYLIMATNTNLEDQVSSSGFGTTSVDLSAPGSGTFTTSNNSSYGVLGGTSSSSPHVAGLIGLIYSIPCPDLGDLMRDDLQSYISLVRTTLLEGVDTLVVLKDRTVTGGRLNARTTVEKMLESCVVELPDLEYDIVSVYPVPARTSLTVEYESPNSDQECLSIYNAIGQHYRDYKTTPDAVGGKRFVLDDLDLYAGVYFLRIPCDNPQADHMIVIQ